MTNYATKDDIKLHQMVIIGTVLKLGIENNESQVQGSETQQTGNINLSNFALKLYNRFAQEREISSVTITNHILQQPAFFFPVTHQRIDWPRSGPVRTVAFFGDC